MTDKFQPLTNDELYRIFAKFVTGKHRVICNESHIHGYDCVDFDDEQTMIIERLRVEVILLRKKLEEIEQIVKK